MTKRKTPFFFTFKGLSNSPIFQYLNFSFHRHFNRDSLKKKAIQSGSQDDCFTFKKAGNAAVNYSRCDKSEYYHYKLKMRMQVIERPHGRLLMI